MIKYLLRFLALLALTWSASSNAQALQVDVADLKSNAQLEKTATIITVGQGFVNSGSLVDAVPESDVETSLAIKNED